MITRLIRWRLSQGDIDHLSETLHPIRSQEEVAGMLGCSSSLVKELERSALRKVLRAMASLETELPNEDANPECTGA